ncbi:hypothetical protein G195_006811 [Phytophthora kernoviae 00238/432]|uniref:Uncharacterized protein n=1 Tax=Phytophthora kernoviae 00238/432 TaxID=1284355 RepID=A0A8J4S2U1_9STRA|nr:hypothetical protein G195_006811 [Phytophthora kernoviae 00238/432]
MSVVAASQPQKNYLVDKKPYFKHFYPKDVAILAVRSAAMQGLMVFNAYVASLDLEDSDLEDSSEDEFEDVDAVANEKEEFVAPSMEVFSITSAKSFGKSLSITTYVRSLEEVALRLFRPQIVSKLIKDISKSATRKYVRTSSRLTAAALMIKTGVRANMLSHLAIFLVEETQQIVVILYRRFVSRKGGKKSKNNLRSIEEGNQSSGNEEEEDSLSTFISSMGRNASRSALAVITGGVGAAVGTVVRPGIGTMIGGTLGDTLGYTSTQEASTVLDVDSLESQFSQPPVVKIVKDSSPEIALPVSDSDSDEDQTKDKNTLSNEFQGQNNRKTTDDSVMVDVEHKEASSTNGFSSQNGNQQQHVLPPLRVLTQKIPIEERDYVDTSLFSPEVSRHAMEVAHRRAKAIANEVKEMVDLEGELGVVNKTKLSPAEAVGIISGAFANSLQRAKQIVKPGTKEYDLLSGSSPSANMAKLDDLDTDGDGLQLSPDASNSDGTHFRTPKIRPALKRISAYSSAALDPEEKTPSTKQQQKKGLQWHEDVLDADEEFYNDEGDGQETHSLMNSGDGDGSGNSNGSPRPQLLNYSSKNDGQLTPRSKKKRKKLVRSMMRRLTPREKEELYRQRPDLMIVPNWAQKYREELAGEDSTRWSTCLLALITALAVLLIVFVLLIVRQRAAAV